MQPVNENEQHECDLCHKTYRRRTPLSVCCSVTEHITDEHTLAGDLLVRHRRHCKPNKPMSKRKSCNACVQARTKCCLTQPTCSRCTERNLVCEYATRRSATSQSPGATTPSLDHGSNNIYGSIMDVSTDVSLDDLIVTTSMSAPSWAPQIPDRPSTNLESYFDYAPFSTGHMNNTDSNHNVTNQTTPQDWLLQRWNPALPSPAAPALVPIAVMTPTVSLNYHEPSKELNMTVEEIPSALPADKVVKMLHTYPVSFASDDYHTPLLHRELYSVSTSEITALPKSSTAIMCALGLERKKNASFLKRAIIAERQRLVEVFVSYAWL